ncbi:MAG: YvcK family protein [Methanomicrobium sp.]|nr:YvcK family protein [Methanomicrobium sp.]
MITVISGGEDSLKLIKALRNLLYDSDISVIADTSDAMWTQGHLVCPNLDDIIYLFSGQLNKQNWTGIKGDTYSTFNFLERLNSNAITETVPDKDGDESSAAQLSDNELASGKPVISENEICDAVSENAVCETASCKNAVCEPAGSEASENTENKTAKNTHHSLKYDDLTNIYPIGDKQRAVCIARAMHLKNRLTITQSTQILSKSFGVTANILPATDSRITAYAKFAGEMFSITDFRAICKTEKTADYKAEIELEFTKYPQITKEATSAINSGKAVIIGPGHISTISPILACRHMRKLLKKSFTIAVLPRLPADYIPGRYIALDRLIETYKGFADILIQDIRDEFCIPDATRINTDTDSSYKAESLAWEIMSHIGSR